MNPIHPHCGPWNAVDPKRSRDPVDRICQEHDNEYGKLQKKHNWITPYLFQSRADDRFIVDMSKQKGVIPKLYNGVFMLKSMIAPRLEEAFGAISPQTNPDKLVHFKHSPQFNVLKTEIDKIMEGQNTTVEGNIQKELNSLNINRILKGEKIVGWSKYGLNKRRKQAADHYRKLSGSSNVALNYVRAARIIITPFSNTLKD